ncbi:hypothetical protein GCM10010341_83770 [Streptomyces noursei]|nr:hypothetical protein GCM10010341_83770 [Streptomyces noursei]
MTEPDLDYVESIASGLTESYEDYCKRLAAKEPAPDGESE